MRTGRYLQYIIFNPLVFTVKLYIELNLAEMVAYIARSSAPRCRCTTPVEEREDLDRYADAAMIVENHEPVHQCRSASESVVTTHAPGSRL